MCSQRKRTYFLTDSHIKCSCFQEWREVPELWCARNKNTILVCFDNDKSLFQNHQYKELRCWSCCIIFNPWSTWQLFSHWDIKYSTLVVISHSWDNLLHLPWFHPLHHVQTPSGLVGELCKHKTTNILLQNTTWILSVNHLYGI